MLCEGLVWARIREKYSIRYNTITSVSLITLVAHKRHTRETKRNYKLHAYHLPPKPGFGYEWESVFPAGVGSDSPSRDAANWLSSSFSRLAETWRQYGG